MHGMQKIHLNKVKNIFTFINKMAVSIKLFFSLKYLMYKFSRICYCYSVLTVQCTVYVAVSVV